MPPAARATKPRKTAAAPPEQPAEAEKPAEEPAVETKPDKAPRLIEPAEVDESKPDGELNVVQAIAEVMRRVGAVGKDRTNNDQGFKFRGVDDLMNAAHPAMAAVGLVCLPHKVLKAVTSQRETRSGGNLYVVRVHMQFRFYGPDGSHLPAEAWGEGVDNFDKAQSKAHTMAYKTCIFQSFHVPTAEASQRDPDQHSVEESRELTAAEKAEREKLARGEAIAAKTKETIAQLHADDKAAFGEWWKSFDKPKEYVDWTDEQVAAVEAKVTEFAAAREKAAAIAAQDAAGEPETAPVAEDAKPADPEPQAAAEPEQTAIEPDEVIPAGTDTTEPPPTQPSSPDGLETWLRRIKMVAHAPNASVALARIWKDGADQFADTEVQWDDKTMPLWQVVVQEGYPPAGQGRTEDPPE